MKQINFLNRQLRPTLGLLIVVAILSACTRSAPQTNSTPRTQIQNAPTAWVSSTPENTATATLPPSTLTATLPPSPSSTPAPAVLIGAGDIALCGDDEQFQGDSKTAAMIESLITQSPDAAVFTAGDNVNADGKNAEFTNCFENTWGQFKERIHPVPGNHEYQTDSANPYFNYFGEAAGTAGLGFYSYDLGDWHIVALNSNCDDIACGPDSAQVKWLKEDLEASAKQCTLAYWHHPRWSSGLAGGQSAATFWKTVVEYGVDVVVNGHDHDYERFAPQDADGNPAKDGVRQFVVGTGGAILRDWGTIKPNSEVRYNSTHGVIQFKLYPGRYEWQFLPVDDIAMTDMGAGECHE